MIARVAARSQAWVLTSPAARAGLLARAISATAAGAPAWVADACEAKGFAPGSAGHGEEWLSGPGLLIRNLRLLRSSLEDLAAGGKPRLPGPARVGPEGQLVARVFPAGMYDRLLVPGLVGEIWMRPGLSTADLQDSQAIAYAPGTRREGRVAVVLGAGNMACLGPRDALYKLIVENCAVVLKTNPVNAYLRPHWEGALSPLIEHGVLAIVDGTSQDGSYLVGHPDVDEVHLTGSAATHDAIVFGAGHDPGSARQRPVLAKPITSELGSVSPVIVVPGPWSCSDLSFQAQTIASMLVHNSGFDCLAVRMLLTSGRWGLRSALLDAVRQALAETPTRLPYYPGAVERREALCDGHPTAERLGVGEHPWVMIPGLDCEDREDECFTRESFCGAFGEVGLAGADVAGFLDTAVAFCNEILWGSLAVTILVHPRTLRDQRARRAVGQAIAGLRYGSIAVNVPHALSFVSTLNTWGAFPGHALSDIQSGRGVVGNTLMFSRAQKSVMRGPWRVRPKPIWFPSSRATLPVSRRVTELETQPSMFKLPGLLADALRS